MQPDANTLARAILRLLGNRCFSRSVPCLYSLGYDQTFTNNVTSEAQIPSGSDTETALITDNLDLTSTLLSQSDEVTLEHGGLSALEDMIQYDWINFDGLDEVPSPFVDDDLTKVNAVRSEAADDEQSVLNPSFESSSVGHVQQATGHATEQRLPHGTGYETSIHGQDDGQKQSNTTSLSTPFYLRIRPKSILEPADKFAQLIARSIAATAANVALKPFPDPNSDKTRLRLYPGMFSLGEVARLIGEYPARMLEPTFASPFIHPTLCRQRPGGPPAPLAVAFACVAMKLQMEKEGMGFVCETMSQERDKLIKQLVSWVFAAFQWPSTDNPS